ncbi:MAG: T9SS type A sorting domain-containing protein [Bacteroidota bacterium]
MKRTLQTIKNAFSRGIGISFILVLAACYTASAQTANIYLFTATTGTFVPLVAPTSSSVALAADDAMSTTIPLTFPFVFEGVTYNDCRVSSNGQLVFGTAGTQSATNNLATATATQRPACAPLWDDLLCSVGVTYQVTGTAGSRIFTAEWLNMKWNYQAAGAVMSFQVKLYETSNEIEFIYRQEGIAYNPGTTGGGSIGITGAAVNNYISIQDVTTHVTSTATSKNDLTTKPATGLVYRFVPPPPCTVAPSAQPTALSFSAVGTTQMSLSFTHASPQPTRYLTVRYPSGAAVTAPVNATYYNVGQALGLGTVVGASNGINLTLTGLFPSTNYDFYIYALADCITGPLYNTTAPLTGSQATAVPTAVSTTATGGLWSAPATWVGGALPSVFDTVIVATGATLTVDIAATAGKVQLNNGSTLFLNNTLVDSTDLVIGTGASFNGFFGTTGRQLTVRGNITNAGAFNMSMPGGILLLNGITPQTVSGAGTFGLIPTLTVNNLTGVVLNTNTTIGAALNLTNGVVSGTGSVTLGNATFSPTFAMTSNGGTISSSVVSGLAGIFPGNAIFTYNTPTPIASITTGNELNIAAAANLNVTFNAIAGGNYILGTNINVNNLTVNDTIDVSSNTLTLNGVGTFGTTQNVFGVGTFTMGANATIVTANLLGITTSGATGSVQTGTRGYNATGNYTYNGATGQVTGDGLPLTLTGGTVTANSTGGTTLTQATVFNNLTLSTNLIIGTNSATINGIGNFGTLAITGAGPFTAGATSRLLLNSTAAAGVLQTSGAVGNIQNTGGRTYTPGLDIVIGGSAVATGDNFPTSGVDSLVLNQTTVVVLTAATSANTLYITSTGRMTTTAVNMLTVAGTLATNVARISTGYIDGPLTRTIGVGAVGNFAFPLGIGTVANLEIDVINPVVTGSSVTLTAIARSLPTGGSVGTGLTALTNTRYWAFAPVSGGTLSSVGNIRIFESTAATLGGTSKKIGLTTAVTTGAFNSIGGQLDSANVNILSSLTIPAFGTAGDSTFLVLGNGSATGSFTGGTFAVGPTGIYKSLTAAVAAINESVSLTGPVVLEFQSTYSSSVETYPIVFRATLPTTSTNSITIRPSSAVSSTINFSGSIFTSTSLIDFNGGKNITIDGRPGGTGTNRYLSFTQQTIGAFPTFRFINEAQNDTLRYITVAGQNTSTASGLIVISTTNGTGGNNNIAINNCTINGLSNTAICIFGSGTGSPADNKNVSITNNNIFDFFVNGISTTAIVAGAGSSNWTISSNNFYQTSIRNSYSTPAMTTATNFRAIQLLNSATNATFTVNNNRVGGNIPGIPGSVFIIGDSISNLAHLIRPLDFSNAGPGGTTNVQGNIISDITLYTNGTDNFTGIGALQTGVYSIGNTTPNVVGSATANGSIKIFYRSTTTTAVARGFHFTAVGGGNMQNNIVGGIDLMVQGAQANGGAITFRGIEVSAAFTAPVTVSGNTVGSTTLANSIQGSTSSLGATGILGMFISGATGAAVSVTNNTISNLSVFNQAFSTNSSIRGIHITGASSISTTVTGNSIRNFRLDAPNNILGDNSSLVGIINSTSGAGAQFISNNTVHSLRSTYNGPVANVVMGVFYNSTNTGGISRVDRNVVHSLETGSTNKFTLQNGINLGSASSTVQLFNNFVRLGVNVDGSTNNANATMYGIWKQNTTNTAVIYNTVYVTGNPATTDTTSLTAAFYKTGSAAIDTVMNNIFMNARSNASGLGEHYAMYVNNTTGMRSDANLYRANGTGGVLWRNGFNRMTAMQQWRAQIKPFDQRSAVGNPAFNAGITNGAATINFTLTATTPAATAAIPLAYITSDQGGNTRSATPAIGSYDIGLSALTAATDIYNPVFTIAPLGNRAPANTAVNAVVVTDIGTGVPTSGATAPKLWYRNSTTASTWASVAPTSFTGTGNNVTFVYNFNWTAIGGTPIVNDRIKYYFVAADAATSANIWYSNYSAIDPIHSTVAAQTTAPLSADSFLVVAALPATLNIPADYPSLTGVGGLFNAINNAALSANTTVTITADINETGLNELRNDGLGGFKLTIQPDATPRTLWGNSTTSMLRFNGVTKVVIDGGLSRNLKLIDSIGTAPSATVGPVVQFYNGCTNDTLVNCILEGNSSNPSSGTVLLGAGANNNIVIANNIIKGVGLDSMNRPSNGIYSSSASNTNMIIGGITARPGGNTIADFSGFAINIAASGDNFIIGSATVSADGNTIYSRAGGGGIMTYIQVNAGSNHMIGNNRIYQPSGNYVGNITGILIGGSGNGHRVTRNSIGGGAPDRSGLSMTSTTGYFRGVDITAGTVTTSIIDSNYFTNISTLGSAGVFAIYLNSGNINVIQNIIGGGFNLHDTIQNGYDNGFIQVAGGNVILIQDNVIGNARYIKAGGDRTCGITVTGTPPSLTIKRNIIRDIYHNGTGSTTTTFSVWGILMSAATNASIIDSNIIYNLYTTNTGAANYPSAGIHVQSAVTNSNFTRNRIYNIGALGGTGTGAAAPSAYGFWIQAGTGNIYANNQISIGNNTVGQTLVYGINETTTGTNTYSGNSIFINGTVASGANNSYGINRASSGTTFTRNNLIYNKRSGGTGRHYALGSASAAGISGVNIQYNMMFTADTAVLAELPATFANGWSGLGTFYTTTYNTNWAEKIAAVAPEMLFIDTAVGNLGIVTTSPAAWYVNGKGIRIIGQTGDFNTTTGIRSGTITTGPVDIGSVEFTPTSVPPVAYADKVPAANDSTQYFFGSRMVAKAVWGAAGTLPTSMDVTYYSGVNPTNTFAGSTFMRAYWAVAQTGGTGYTYALTLMQDSAVLGTVSSPANLGIARYLGTTTNWTRYIPTVANNVTGFMNTASVNAVGIFTGTDVTNNPLPVKLTTFTASVEESKNVLVSWTTASEENNKGFEVERSIDGKRFGFVGFVEGAGNSNTAATYNLMDKEAFAKENADVLYYRLKQIDFDGNSTYSQTVMVSINAEETNGLSVYPNPFLTDYSVSFTATNNGETTVQLFDLQGKMVSSQVKDVIEGFNTIPVTNVDQLHSGVYFMKVTLNGETRVMKLVKN